MIVSIPKTVRRLYFMTLLVAFSCLLYYALNWIGGWISPVDHYEIPEGSAVRAFQSAPHNSGEFSAGERLRLYYWYGE